MYPTSNVQVVLCVVCDAPATHFYPGPLCEQDWREWAV